MERTMSKASRKEIRGQAISIVIIILLFIAIVFITASIFKSDIIQGIGKLQNYGWGALNEIKDYATETYSLIRERLGGLFSKQEAIPVQEQAVSSQPLNISGLEYLLGNEGFTKVEINITGSSLLLQKECRALVLPIADTQLLSIYYGLKNESYARPLTHDLIAHMLNTFDIKIKAIRIAGMQDSVYTANILLEEDGNLLNLDARPSDAVGIAVRTNTDVYVKDEIMEQFGEKVC